MKTLIALALVLSCVAAAAPAKEKAYTPQEIAQRLRKGFWMEPREPTKGKEKQEREKYLLDQAKRVIAYQKTNPKDWAQVEKVMDSAQQKPEIGMSREAVELFGNFNLIIRETEDTIFAQFSQDWAIVLDKKANKVIEVRVR